MNILHAARQIKCWVFCTEISCPPHIKSSYYSSTNHKHSMGSYHLHKDINNLSTMQKPLTLFSFTAFSYQLLSIFAFCKHNFPLE